MLIAICGAVASVCIEVCFILCLLLYCYVLSFSHSAGVKPITPAMRLMNDFYREIENRPMLICIL